MPNAVPVPRFFLERMSHLLGDEYAAFVAALEGEPVSGLRVNTLKIDVEAFRKLSPFPLGEPVPWCNSAFTLAARIEGEGEQRKVGLHPYHLAGLYYIQDPSAMSAATLLDPQPGERVLDLAAAPGGKTTQLSALMQGRGLLVANEIKTKRLNHLIVNVERWGAPNVVVTNETPERLADHFGPFFDRVLVDAPCSGEGMFRKDMGARQDWSQEMVAGCALRQRNILRVAAKLVRPGGYLLYSTCTFAPEEDEEVIAQFLVEYPEYETVSIPLFPGFMAGRPDWINAAICASGRRKQRETELALVDSLDNAVRLFPHRLTGEGHFACLLKRTRAFSADEHPAPLFERHPARLTQRTVGLWCNFAEAVLGQVDFAEENLRVVGDRLYWVQAGLPDLRGLRVAMQGIWLGNVKKDRFEPAHPLALFLRSGQAQNALDLPSVEATGLRSIPERGRSPLQQYLRGESIPSDGVPGWVLVTVDGWPLGWGKRVQGVVKNHYPRGWQIYS